MNTPNLKGKSILITGGTGSFGKRMMRRLIRDFKPRRVAIYSRGEHPHMEIMSDLSPEEKKVFRSFIGDVRDAERLRMAMREVDLVIHAAALKHVPIAEYNPFECIGTNIIGAENVARAAIDSGVKQVIALSTDKACDPINLYGATKLASDKIFVAANSYAGQSGTRMCVVRYGNVVGSQGSVVPFFQKLVNEGATEIPITDNRMTRFWITLDQAVDFVLSSIDLMRGGEIFVPKIPSMNIIDLAEAVAPGLPHKHVGKRPGEKLHEVMISEHVSHNVIDMNDRYAIEPEWSFWEREPFDKSKFEQVEDEFRYSSDNNKEWLSVEDLRTLVKEGL
ncbi:UDP-N-acetylglucosamine 4,6-dehydratase (inverting) [Temperatibacter marinus]